MTIDQFRKHMADGLPVENGSEAHLLMHEMAQGAHAHQAAPLGTGCLLIIKDYRIIAGIMEVS